MSQISRRESLARQRYHNKRDDAAWEEVEKDEVAAGKERKMTQQPPGRHEKALASVSEDINRIQEAPKGKLEQGAACLRRLANAHEKRKEFMSKLQSKGIFGPKLTESHREIESSSRPGIGSENRGSQAARLAPRIPHGNVAKSKVPFLGRSSTLRARGTHSDNSFFLKRAKVVENLSRNKRTLSDPSFRKIQLTHYRSVTGASEKLVHFREQSSSTLQTALPPTYGRAGAELVKPLPSTEARNQDENLLATKRLASRLHNSSYRPSDRQLRSSRRTSNSKRSGGSLRHDDESKKRGSSSEPERRSTNLSMRLRSRTKHIGGGRKKSPPVGRKMKIQPKTTRATDGARTTDLTKEKPQVKIPADTKMATNLRGYSQWPDDSGSLMNTRGCLLPAKYEFSGIEGFDWICPIRSCRISFQSQRRLGFHFITCHHSCRLNDNCDGTFTILGKYHGGGDGDHCPALVESKNPLPPNGPPMIRPRPPKTGFSAQQKNQWTMASQNKMRAMTAPESGELPTVDELMLHPGFLGLPADENSGSSGHRELSHVSPDQDAQKRLSSPPVPLTSGPSSPDYPGPEGNTARSLRLDKSSEQDDVSNVSRNATKENCRLIRKFVTGRPFYPPKRGHFAALLSTPRTRDIILRPGLRFVADQPKKVRLLIVHLTGEEAAVPCNSCSMDRGPFKKCVAISKAAAGETTSGIVCCTNCASKRGLPQKCNVEDGLGRPAAGIKRIRRKAGPVSEPREQPNLGETGTGVTSLEATASRVTKVDNAFTFRLYSLPVDGSLGLDADPQSLRLCSVAAGKVMVELEENMPFLIGTHGMFKLCPEASVQVTNASGEEAVLHVSALKV